MFDLLTFQYGGGGGGLDLCQLLAIGAFLAVAAAAAAALFLQITASQNKQILYKNFRLIVQKLQTNSVQNCTKGCGAIGQI